MNHIYDGLSPNASEFCGVRPLNDHPNAHETVRHQMDLLDGNSLKLAQFVTGNEFKLEFANDTYLHCALIESPEVMRAARIRVIETSLRELYKGEQATILGATAGGSMLKPGQIMRHSGLEYNKLTKHYVDIPELEGAGYTRESLLAGGGYHEDEQGIWTPRAKWLPFGALTADVMQVHVNDPATGAFTPYF